MPTKGTSEFSIPLVDWSGNLLDPNDRTASELALSVLAEAENRVTQRGGTKSRETQS